MSELLNISPIDGRYAKKTHILEPYFSEFALIKYRTEVEIKWLIFLVEKNIIDISLSDKEIKNMQKIVENFSVQDAEKVKKIESETKHDVKAVEYFLREKFKKLKLQKLDPFIHITLTSEDINNTSYSLMIKNCLENVYFPEIERLINILNEISNQYINSPMLGHTHGQVATPTTVGKEFKIFEYRIKKVLNYAKNIKICSKFSGAVGNYNCHVVAYPDVDWINLTKDFVESLELEYNPVTTQIESHDMVCLLLSHIKIINNIIKDLNSDMWLYISKNYFTEKAKSTEVGSSVMPHKVNPINHENSMANVELSNSIIDALVNNLSISRMQRDLSDSSKMRNLGVAFGHSLISISETIVGLNKIEVNSKFLNEQLDNNYAVLTEAVQTVLRKNKIENAYELLKNLSRGKTLTKNELHEFVKSLPISDSDKKKLLSLKPSSYVGLASKIVEEN